MCKMQASSILNRANNDRLSKCNLLTQWVYFAIAICVCGIFFAEKILGMESAPKQDSTTTRRKLEHIQVVILGNTGGNFMSFQRSVLFFLVGVLSIISHYVKGKQRDDLWTVVFFIHFYFTHT